MNVSDSELLTILDFLLQRQVHLYVKLDDEKTNTIKKGLLLNYNIKIPFIQYTIKLDNDKIRDYYLNLPFSAFKKDDKVIFSYKINDLCEMSDQSLDFLKSLEYSSESKLYDNYLYIDYE
jgi:hypothetical protein